MIALLTEVERFIARPQPLRIAGQAIETENVLEVIDPSTASHFATTASAGAFEVDLAVKSARAAFDDGPWGLMQPLERARILHRLADLIEAHAEAFGQLDALDNGKPFAKARDIDAMGSAGHMRYFAGWADRIEGRTIPVSSPERLNYTLAEPIGVCGLICPWNYPLLMAIWKLAPALAAGNTVVLKPSEETPLSALYLADVALEAGLPEGVLNVIPGTGSQAGAALVAHPGVDKIGFTGSTETGKLIAQSAARSLKRVSLELGGKAANVIFSDADLERAIPGAFWAAFGNNGQSCTAGARLYVHKSNHDRVLDGLIAMIGTLSIGPGMEAQDHDLGPLISRAQRAKVLDYIKDGLAQGADLVTGGHAPQRSGWFLEPTVLTGVSDQMRVAREEAFGPLLTVLTFEDEDDVVARANDTPFGLAAGFWSRDASRARHMAKRLRAGTVWVNCWGETNPASPFGGIKQSGYGREMGQEAISLYSQTKSVWVA